MENLEVKGRILGTAVVPGFRSCVTLVGLHQLPHVLGLVSRGREVRDEVEVGCGALQTVQQATRWGGEIRRRQIFQQ
jgi:hypothetical protein